jgi:lipopolysaccharide/colanic/teichoic acid biosynthesis glycosyltransferase
MQRSLDIIFSGMALVFLSPLFIPLMLVLRLTGEGEIFFTQERIGKYGNPIKLFKFATMLKDSPNIGTGTLTLHNDPRVLPLGGLLRKTKINELPQLINIFIGDMSVIGPRPQTQRCFKAFPIEFQNIIMEVKPGLSGIGSIIFRNEEQMMHDSIDANKFYDEAVMPYKAQLEAWYVKNNTIRIYFLLIITTVYSVLFGSNKIVFKLFPSLPTVPKNLIDNIL